MDSACCGDSAVMCEGMNIELVPVPTDAQFSHGNIERRILALKEMSRCRGAPYGRGVQSPLQSRRVQTGSIGAR